MPKLSRIGSTTNEEFQSIHPLENGQLAYIGNFQSQLNLDNKELKSYGKSDLFIWIKHKKQATSSLLHLGSLHTDKLQASASDSQGNLYLAGTFKDTLYYQNKAILNSSEQASFIIKLNPSYKVIWAKTIDNSFQVRDLYIDSMKHIYLTGFYSQTWKLENRTWKAAYGNTVFIHKWDKYANILWTKEYTKTYSTKAYGKSIAEDADGNIYVAGEFLGDLRIEDTTFQSNPAHSDLFLSKYHPKTGQLIWTKHFSGVYDDHIVCLLSNKEQNLLYWVGYFEGILNWGKDKNISAFRYKDAYIACLDTQANLQWKTQSNTYHSHLYVRDAIFRNNSIYLTGYFEEEAIMDTFEFKGIAKTDAYWASCSSNGIWTNLEVLRSNQNIFGNAIYTDQQQVYIAGAFQDTLYIPHHRPQIALGAYDAFEAIYTITKKIEKPNPFPIPDLLDFTIQPSDHSNFLRLLVNNPPIEGQIIWKLYTLDGTLYLEGKGNKINTKPLESGIYSLNIHLGNYIGIKKIQIQ
ncbi:MAG: hypothetical protein MK212_06170 [Saprospiraceae bacterium]|nr:hypothetical protein [Saprospiraceae bacterium]